MMCVVVWYDSIMSTFGWWSMDRMMDSWKGKVGPCCADWDEKKSGHCKVYIKKRFQDEYAILSMSKLRKTMSFGSMSQWWWVGPGSVVGQRHGIVVVGCPCKRPWDWEVATGQTNILGFSIYTCIFFYLHILEIELIVFFVYFF